MGTDSGAGVRIPLTATGVLRAGSTNAPYVAEPGSYTLELRASSSDGACTGTGTLWQPNMTYVLLGTAP